MNLLALTIAITASIFFVYLANKYRKYLGLYVIAVVLFLPKMNIVNLSAEASAGLRTDDLIILFFLLYTLIVEKFKTYKSVFSTLYFRLFLLYMISSGISFLWGLISQYTFSLSLSFFGMLRKVEYFSFVFVGYDLYYFYQRKTKIVLKKLLDVFIIFTAIIAFLQVAKLLGSFRFGVWDTGSFLGRATGTFNGPYELSATCVIAAIIYYYDLLKSKTSKLHNLLYFTISCLLVLLSQSRSSLLILVFILILMNFIYSNKKLKIVIGITCVGLAVLFIVLVKFTELPMLARFRGLHLEDLWYSTQYYFNHRSYDEYLRTIQEGVVMEQYVIQTGDISFNVRIFKWMALLEIILKFPLWGYGFGSNLVIDGNYIKLLAENGIIGTALFLAVFWVIMGNLRNKKRQSYLIWAVVSVLLGSILIDMFEASKVMELLWFMIGTAGLSSNKCTRYIIFDY